MITAGPRNRTGPQGLRGIAGKDGKDGSIGPAGEDGKSPDYEWRGTEIRFKKPNGQWGKWVDLKGERGKTGLGFVGPAGPPGEDGTGSGSTSNLCDLALFTVGLVSSLLVNQYNDVLTDSFGFALGKEFGMIPKTCLDEYNSGLSDADGNWLYGNGEMLI